MFKRKGGWGGGKGLLNNVKKNALFLRDGFPYPHLHQFFLTPPPSTITAAAVLR